MSALLTPQTIKQQLPMDHNIAELFGEMLERRFEVSASAVFSPQ